MVAKERHKPAAFQHLHGERITVLFDELQFLVFRVPYGKDDPAAFRKLREKRLRDRRSGSRNKDGVERSKFRQAKCAIATMYVRIRVAKPSQLGGSTGSKLRPSLNRENFLSQA